MRKHLRSHLAAVLGAAVVAAGAGAAYAAPAGTAVQRVAADPIELDVAAADLFVPFKTDNEVKLTIKVAGPYGDAGLSAVPTARLLRAGDAESDAGKWTTLALTPASLPSAPTPTASGSPTPPPPGQLSFTTSFKITAADPSGTWKLRVEAPRKTGSPDQKTFDLAVDPKIEIVAAAVSPDPVEVKSGTDTKVSVKASVKGAGTLSARLVNDDADEHYELPEFTKGSDGLYRSAVHFDGTTTPGRWVLQLKLSRGADAIQGDKSFQVRKVKSKARSKVVLTASPKKVKQGKTIKLYGKVYRGTAGYGGKMIELYYKKKGTTSWKFVTFVKATSSGKFAKNVKARWDAHWRVRVPGTTYTHGSLSTPVFVDVR
jgi:hypothetical protein